MKNLKIVRIWRGMSQDCLARDASCSQTTVSESERGVRTNNRPGLADRFANALEVSREILEDDITLIPVPKRWEGIHKEPRFKTIIDELLSLTTDDLTRYFHMLITRKGGAATA